MILRSSLTAVTALSLVACQTNSDVDYDTADPYGIPDYSDTGPASETADYQPVNPPADATYGPAAYEHSAPAPSTPAAPTTAARSHTIATGDTLWGLSRQYGVSVDAIKAANGMTSDTVVLGKTLNIPGN